MNNSSSSWRNLRKACANAFVAFAFLFGASGAHAGPMIWGPSEFNPASNVYFAGGGAACTALAIGASCESLTYSHDLTLLGFVPGVSSLDQIGSGLLEVWLADDGNDRPNEALKLTLEGLLQPGTFDAAAPFSFHGVVGALLVSLQGDGVLNVILTRQNGDFHFDRSEFTAYGTRTDAKAAPEPATLMLLGAGALAAGVRARRRRLLRA